jgi:hypothetical protein
MYNYLNFKNYYTKTLFVFSNYKKELFYSNIIIKTIFIILMKILLKNYIFVFKI